MIDFLMAVLGRRHCGWCSYKDDNIVERWAGGFRSERRWYHRAVWWLYTHGGLGLWRLGQRWHWRFHRA